MAVFIEARTEPFEAQREEMAREMREGGRGSVSVRRPVRGIQAKENTYAVIRVMGPDGRFIPVIDAAGDEYSVETDTGVTTQYSNFFIRNVQEQRHEKQQIVETFGDSWIFFFGEAPRMWNVSGMLLNTADFNWRAEWWENYERYFRGTRLVELGARLYIMYDDIIVEGYMVSANAQEAAEPVPAAIPFNFQMFVTGYSNISRIGDPQFPTPTDLDYAQLSSYEQAIQNWQRGRNLQRELSTEAVKAANREEYTAGVGRLLADTIASGIINAGDPSISSFVSRAQQAISYAQQLANPNFQDLGRTYTADQNANRQQPLRQEFGHNIDEFIGQPEGRTARQLANPLSMADRWLEMDRRVDEGVGGLLSTIVDVTTGMFDVMGRAGRAAASIRDSGGERNSSQSVNRGEIIGAGIRSEVSRFPRDRPFGMTALPGEML